MSIILKDIADKMNVSVSTVSKAINDRPGISIELRSKILQTIEEMGYQPTVRPERLKTPEKNPNATQTVNLTIRVNDSYLTDPFYSVISQEITKELQQNQFNVSFNIINKRSPADHEFSAIFESSHPTAHIIAGADIDPRLFERIAEIGIPTVLIDNRFNGFSSVNTDNFQGAQSAVEYLISLGHRDILCLTGPLGHKSIQDRYQGYLQALGKQEFPLKPRIIECDGVSINDGIDAVNSLEDILFSAVFGCTDKLAIGAMKALQKRAIKVPDAVSVMGFDDIEWGLHTEPALTTIRTAKRQVARLATKLLFDLLENKDSYRTDIVVGTELIIRESTSRKSIGI